jgi:hypothetical protein
MPNQEDIKLKTRSGKHKTNKWALVKGVSARLPIELLDEPSFKSGLQEITRGYSGIYFCGFN